MVTHEGARQAGILLLLALSAAAFALAPAAVAPGYSWVRHSISESAAQGLDGAWVARSGFLLFGLAVLWLASACRPRWGRWATAALGGFGVMMLATAAFSHRPWLPGVPGDEVEDLLHSASATIMGLALVVGVVAVGRSREDATWLDRGLDGLVVVASVGIPLVMAQDPPYAGVLQRLMFLVAYGWYGWEAARGGRAPGDAVGEGVHRGRSRPGRGGARLGAPSAASTGVPTHPIAGLHHRDRGPPLRDRRRRDRDEGRAPGGGRRRPGLQRPGHPGLLGHAPTERRERRAELGRRGVGRGLRGADPGHADRRHQPVAGVGLEGDDVQLAQGVQRGATRARPTPVGHAGGAGRGREAERVAEERGGGGGERGEQHRPEE